MTLGYEYTSTKAHNEAQLYEKHFCFVAKHKGFCSHYSIPTTQTLGMGAQLMLPFAAEILPLAMALEKAVAWCLTGRERMLKVSFYIT